MRFRSIVSVILLGESGNETERYNDQYTELELKPSLPPEKFLVQNFHSKRNSLLCSKNTNHKLICFYALIFMTENTTTVKYNSDSSSGHQYNYCTEHLYDRM